MITGEAITSVLCFVVLTLGALADDLKRDAFNLAESALELAGKGKQAEAQEAFLQFQKSWEEVRKDSKFYHKRFFTLATECFLRFGEDRQACEVAYEIMDTSAHPVPTVPFFLVKSLYRMDAYPFVVQLAGDHPMTFEGLDKARLQEAFLMGGLSYSRMGKLDPAKRTLERAISIMPDSENGKTASAELQRLKEGPPVQNSEDTSTRILVDILANDKSGPHLKSHALLLLGAASDKTAYEPLVQGVRSDNKRIREAAIRGLGRYGNPRALEILKQIVASEKEEKAVRDVAGIAVREIEKRKNDAIQNETPDTPLKDDAKPKTPK